MKRVSGAAATSTSPVTSELHGIIPALATAFGDDEEIDEVAMRQEVRYLLQAGVHGVNVGGSGGEGYALTLEENCRLTQMVVDEVGGRVPVVGGIIQDSTRGVIRYGMCLKEIGVDAVQIPPIHYTSAPNPEGMLAFYREIGDALQLPLIVYNVLPWSMIDVPTLLKLADLEWVVGIKQSGGDIHRLANLLQAVHASGRSIRVFSAVDALLFASYLIGAHGSISAIVAVLPRQSIALWEACQAGEIHRARAIHEQILPVWRFIEGSDRASRERFKAAIEVQGRHVGRPRSPMQPSAPEVRNELKRLITASGELGGLDGGQR